MDQGGGSLEVILFSGGQLHQAISLPLGAVRLLHRYQNGERGKKGGNGESAEVSHLAEEVIESCARDCGRLLEESGIDWELAAGRPWAGTGGAFTMTRLVRAGVENIGFDQTDPWLGTEAIRETMRHLAGMTLEERIAVAGLPPNRADIMPISLVPVLEILRLARVDRIMHSFHNLRYGLAAEMLG